MCVCPYIWNQMLIHISTLESVAVSHLPSASSNRSQAPNGSQQPVDRWVIFPNYPLGNLT